MSESEGGVTPTSNAAGSSADTQDHNQAAKVVAVVITFNPPNLLPLLSELERQVAGIVVVDNGSTPASLPSLRQACERHTLVEIGENIGIAAAQNLGIEQARGMGAEYVLLSDHDSVPAPNMVSKLLSALEADEMVGAAGPLPSEDREGADQLVYVARKWAPKRAHPEELAQPTLDVEFLVASGCLIRMRCLDSVGDMNTALFIDHVDLEWGLRARRSGWRLVCVPAATLHHSLGDEVVMLPGRTQPVHVHSPMRNYYILRNTLFLVREGGELMPSRWRLRYAWWALKYLAFNGFLVDRLPQRRTELRAAMRDARRGRKGRRG